MSEEEWRPVVGWEGLYEVSSHGRLRNLKFARIVKGSPNATGHLVTRLWRDGKPTHAQIHRLVCEAFHGPAPEGKPLVLHWDDNPGNNTAMNLRWGDLSDNQRDSVRNGTHVNTKKTHCLEGHPLSEENTYNLSSGRRECKTCWRRNRKQWKSDRTASDLAADDNRHGTVTGYIVYKCRCADCTLSYSEHSKTARLKRHQGGNLPEGDPRHGRAAGYKVWGCKCDECRAWNARTESDRKKRRAESSQAQN